MSWQVTWLGKDGEAIGTAALTPERVHLLDEGASMSREQAMGVALTMLRRQHEPSRAGQVPADCHGFLITAA